MVLIDHANFPDDPKLSSKTDETENKDEDEEIVNSEEQLQNIRKKLKTNHQKKNSISKLPQKNNDDEDEFAEYYLHKDRDLERQKKM